MTDPGAGREDFKGRVGTTAAESQPWWPDAPAAPPGAPNVLIIALDDTGFAHLGCFGSDIETPHIDALAARGLRYNNFHTTALCSPTRACLLTGRNHHSVGMRFLSNTDTGFSNCRGVISPKAATLAEVMRSNGYNTYALGKWHLANMEDCGPAGPFDHWPLQRGFDRYYGFMGGATDQFSPELTIDNRPVNPPSHAGYHLSEDLVDQAIGMINGQRSTGAGRPFMMYLAFGATHSPHQAPRAYIDKYRGRYDRGWDVVRAEWFARQKSLGVVPADARLAPRNPDVDAWDTLGDDQRRLYARMQEAFAGFLDHTDHQVGRLMAFLQEIDCLDNTLVVFLSDNGASQEGGRDGMLNELAYFNRLSEPVADMIGRIDQIGGPNLYNNYPRGWAQVGNTPLRFYKQNTHEGGIRDPLIVSWPARIKAAGQVRTPYHHVTDIFPTILECVGIQAPQVFKGMPQLPVEGVSFAYSFDNDPPRSRKQVQYYEMLGHRAIWADGWKAVTRHKPGEPFDADRWMLYNTDQDFAEFEDLAEQRPDKLQSLVSTWWAEAGRYNVLPLDDRGTELFALRRPRPGGPALKLRFLPGTPHIDRFAVPDIRNRSFGISARFDRASTQMQGALVACGGRTGGYCLYVQDNRACFAYNRIGRITTLRSALPLPDGPCIVAMRFTKTQEHAGTVQLLVDGQPAGEMPMALMPWRQSVFGMDIGADHGSTVTPDYAAPFAFEGRLLHIDYALGTDRDDVQKALAIEARNAMVDQ
ncbi:MAG: arylsulfatase [Aquabacterium sp.]